jgi:predicted DNA-binding transcriptional regulator YafY
LKVHGCAALRTLPSSRITEASASEVKNPPQVALLRDAIRRQRKVVISYKDADGSLSDRAIWPIASVHFDDLRVLAAWCEPRSAFRHFRVDRLDLRTVSEERYPGRRQSIARRWRQQNRDWRSMLTLSDTSKRYKLTDVLSPSPMPKER